MIKNRVKQAPSSWQSYLSQAVNFVTFLYIKGGVLPWFLVLAVLGFSLSSEYFLTQTNLSGISMHATYLVLVAMAQMLVMLTAGLDLSVGVMIATGMNDEEISAARDACKAQIGFYGSTPAYKVVLEQHGWEGVQMELNQLTKKGLWQDIAGLVTDEMLESIAVTGTPSEVSTQIFDRYGNIAARIAPSIFSGDPAVTAELIKELKN